MQSGNLEYRGADGKRYVGFLVRPDKPSGAAVVIAHSAFGLADHERDFATRLAQSGYIVLAADYHGDGELLPVETMMTRIGPVLADPSLVRPAMLAGLNALRAQDGVDSKRIVSAGFCFGGAAVFELACTGEDVKAAVGFHSSLPTNRPEDAKAIKGAILMLQGAADPMVPPEMRNAFEAQMNEMGVDWSMMLYGGTLHGFTMKGVERSGFPGVAYLERADKRSWRAMLDLFDEKIGKP